MSDLIRSLTCAGILAAGCWASSALSATSAGMPIGLTVRASCKVHTVSDTKRAKLEAPRVSCTLGQPFSTERTVRNPLQKNAPILQQAPSYPSTSENDSVWTIMF